MYPVQVITALLCVILGLEAGSVQKFAGILLAVAGSICMVRRTNHPVYEGSLRLRERVVAAGRLVQFSESGPGPCPSNRSLLCHCRCWAAC